MLKVIKSNILLLFVLENELLKRLRSDQIQGGAVQMSIIAVYSFGYLYKGFAAWQCVDIYSRGMSK